MDAALAAERLASLILPGDKGALLAVLIVERPGRRLARGSPGMGLSVGRVVAPRRLSGQSTSNADRPAVRCE
jgi:hypothetical protein